MTTDERSGGPVSEYYGIDPRQRPSPQRLHGIKERLRDYRGSGRLNTLANVYVELAQHPETSKSARSRSFHRFAKLIESRLPNGEYSLQDMHLEEWRAYTPVVKYGQLRAAKTVAMNNVAQLIRAKAQSKEAQAEHVYGMHKGQTVELLVGLLLGNVGLHVTPSFAREDCHSGRIDGKKYRWDLTAASDGYLIPAGEYRVQTKSTSSEMSGYHPDIVRVIGSRLFDGCDNWLAAASDMCDQVISGGRSGTADIRDHQVFLLERLAQHGPVDT